MGKFTIVETLSDGSEKVLGESENRIVYDGRKYIEDMAFGINSWYQGAIQYDATANASGYWRTSDYQTLALGCYVDDNTEWLSGQGYTSGVYAAGTGLAITGGAVATDGGAYGHLPNLEDSFMSSILASDTTPGNGLYYGDPTRVIRTGRQVTIEKTFDVTNVAENTGVETILTGTQIRELGYFVGGDPTGQISPSTDVSQRPYAMIARSVRYKVNGDYIEDDPIVVGENPITVRYEVGDI